MIIGMLEQNPSRDACVIVLFKCMLMHYMNISARQFYPKQHTDKRNQYVCLLGTEPMTLV